MAPSGVFRKLGMLQHLRYRDNNKCLEVQFFPVLSNASYFRQNSTVCETFFIHYAFIKFMYAMAKKASHNMSIFWERSEAKVQRCLECRAPG